MSALQRQKLPLQADEAEMNLLAGWRLIRLDEDGHTFLLLRLNYDDAYYECYQQGDQFYWCTEYRVTGERKYEADSYAFTGSMHEAMLAAQAHHRNLERGAAMWPSGALDEVPNSWER